MPLNAERAPRTEVRRAHCVVQVAALGGVAVGLCCHRCRTSDVDAVLLGDALEAGRGALADGPELPVRAVAVQLAEDHGGLGAGVLRQVVAGDFVAGGVVDDPDEGPGDLAEVLAALVGLVDGDREDDLVDVGREAGEVDLDLLVVAVAVTVEVVAGVLDGAVRRGQVAVEDEELLVEDLAVGLDGDRARVDVELRAGGGALVPAEADGDVGQLGHGDRRGAGRRCRRVGVLLQLLLEVDVATLVEADAHDAPSRASMAVHGLDHTKRHVTVLLQLCQYFLTIIMKKVKAVA